MGSDRVRNQTGDAPCVCVFCFDFKWFMGLYIKLEGPHLRINRFFRFSAKSTSAQDQLVNQQPDLVTTCD